MDFLIGWPGGDWQATARLAGTLVGGYLALIWLATVLWVYRDISGRTRDPVSQTVSVAIAVVLPLIGLPIYLALRPSETLQDSYDRQLEQEALLSEMQSPTACPNCRRPTESDFVVCAYCGTSLRSPCAQCGNPMRHAWRYCPHCAAPREPEPARSVAAIDLGTGDEAYDQPAAVSDAPADESPATHDEVASVPSTARPARPARLVGMDEPPGAEARAPAHDADSGTSISTGPSRRRRPVLEGDSD